MLVNGSNGCYQNGTVGTITNISYRNDEEGQSFVTAEKSAETMIILWKARLQTVFPTFPQSAIHTVS